jgi:hypothetical protein
MIISPNDGYDKRSSLYVMIIQAHHEGMLPNHHFILATKIAEHGIDAHHDEVVRYVAALRRNGHDGMMLDIAADPTHPAVARERAFGRLLSHLGHRRTATEHAHAA